MKKTLIYIIAFLLIFCAVGCDNGNQTQTSGTSRNESLESIESIGTSSEVLIQNYPFLESAYVVTSSRESAGILYVCNYYFVDGLVEGARLTTTLPDEETAYKYYQESLEDYPDTALNGKNVTHYLYDEDLYYYGYTLEKLEFVLTTALYEYTVDFDKDIFNALFYDTSED